jgi:hypothetical protein
MLLSVLVSLATRSGGPSCHTVSYRHQTLLLILLLLPLVCAGAVDC